MKILTSVFLLFVLSAQAQVLAQLPEPLEGSTTRSVWNAEVMTPSNSPGTLRELLVELTKQTNGKFDFRVGPGTADDFLDRVTPETYKVPMTTTLAKFLTITLQEMQKQGIPIAYQLQQNTIILSEILDPQTRPAQYTPPQTRPPMNYQVPPAGPVPVSGGYAVNDADFLLTRMANDLAAVGLGNLTLGSHAVRSYGYGYNNSYPTNQGYGGVYNYVDCTMIPGNRDCTHGGIWIDGPPGEKFLQQFDIYVDGFYIGPASKYNRWPNKGRRVKVGPSLIQIVHINDDMIVYEVNVDVESVYALKGQSNIIRFDESRMLHGPFRRRISGTTNDALSKEKAGNVLRRPGGN